MIYQGVLLIVLIIFWAFVTILSQWHKYKAGKEYIELIKRGELLLKDPTQSKYEEALKCYYNALSLDCKNKNSREIKNKIGICEFNLGNYKEIIERDYFSNNEDQIYYRLISVINLEESDKKIWTLLSELQMINFNRFIEICQTYFDENKLYKIFFNSLDTNSRRLFYSSLNKCLAIDLETKFQSDKLDSEIIELFKKLEVIDLSLHSGDGSFRWPFSESKSSIQNLNFLFLFPKLKYLNLCGHKNLLNINGLKYVEDLIELNMSKTKISSITPIKKLSNLKFLNLNGAIIEGNGILNLSPIYDIGLEGINLSNQLKIDFSQLSNIKTLKTLILISTNLKTLKEIERLKNIETLELSWNSLADAEVEFPKLKYITQSSSLLQNLPKFLKCNPSLKFPEPTSRYSRKSYFDFLIMPSKMDIKISKIHENIEVHYAYLRENREYPIILFPIEFQKSPKGFLNLNIEGPQINDYLSITSGVTENYFYKKLTARFGTEIVLRNHYFNPRKFVPFFPDFIIKSLNYNIYIDVEIDEPYTLKNNSPTHFIEEDDSRNYTFIAKNWFVIRFTESQIVNNTENCIELIDLLMQFIISKIEGSNATFKLEFPFKESMWTEEQAHEKAMAKYRNSYLDKIK